MQFWGHAQWQNDGETSAVAANQPFDPWIFNADWRNGNFCVSGSRGRGRLQIVRNATGVRLGTVEADAFLAKRGVNHTQVCVDSERPSEDEIRKKMHELITSGMDRDLAAKSIRTIPGFELVGNEEARRSVAGYVKRGRRPKIRDEIRQEKRSR